MKKQFTLIFSAISLMVFLVSLTSSPAWANEPQSNSEPSTAISTPVNINTADAETLANTLSGVGIKKAEAIVAYRSDFGPFAHVDELADVKGIGKATVEKNLERITLQ